MTATIVAAVLAAVFTWLGWWWAAAGSALAWLAVALFFRSPVRRVERDLPPGTMLSPADGTVSAVETVEHAEAVGGPATVIRVFLSVLDVHVNRSPHDARVVGLRYTPGRFHDARSALCPVENENQLITMEIEGGRIGVRQIAGKVARRIVCDLRPGDRVARGQPFGMIKFGSSTELILPRPHDVTVRVRPGDRVKAGVTVVATLRARGGGNDRATEGLRD